MQIIVTGCVAQAEGDEILKRNKNVDYILGPQNFHKLPSVLKNKNKQKVHSEFSYKQKFESLVPSAKKNVSKLVTIQEGCDKFCSFCVVPYTRGAEFSRPVEQIFAEIKHLSNNGAKEITLLGQNVSSYNSDIFEYGEKKSFTWIFM